MAQRPKIQLTGAETIRAEIPLQRKGSAWSIEPRPVSYFPELGETEADAQAFAASLARSFETFHAARLAEIAIPSIGYDETRVPTDAKGKRLAPPAVPARGSRPFHSMHSPDIAVLAARFNATPRAERRASVARFAARLEAERAVRASEVEAAAVASALASSGPTADQLLADQHYAENVTAAAAARSHGRKPRKAAPVIQDRTYAEAVAAVPDAFTVCNGCEVRPMVASEHPGYAAGLCAECYADAIAGTIEPDPAPTDVIQVRVDGVTVATTRRIDISGAPEPETPAEIEPTAEPDDYDPAPDPTAAPVLCSACQRDMNREPHAPDCRAAALIAARFEQDRPAPVLTVVPSRTRPTCERCGQTFRVSGTGYAWHVANRPDCASKRLAVVA